MSIHLKFIKSKSLATRLFLSLDYTSRKGFYKALNCDSKDAVYEMVTDQHIARVPVDQKKAIDKAMSRHRNRKARARDAANRVENECCWRAMSWYFHEGTLSNGLLLNLTHCKAVYDALRQVYREDWK